MSAKWIRVGDLVRILSGKDKGKTGKVLARKGLRVVVEGMNKKTKHVKKSGPEGKGSILSIESPVHISNVSLCFEDGSLLKLRVREHVSGTKELIWTNVSGEVQVFRTIRKARVVTV
ncbi:50S ribosomal protein L24 [Candidatus Similichlamydia laticola]|uniref:Large ribosomal subunit protein uL24 n=1 Tax=Candidatus Similichlamydia laticola TaxID=2170265 RepID=A0A369K9W1_9BACT|nr:50S ribosomal protein L24 [Candidatus Similichlamydia laticola]RDB31389.1 LSU ribosomal protein L24p (L26e) [Candidatus Similichlamydia laticola]